jgi:thymidylate synthase
MKETIKQLYSKLYSYHTDSKNSNWQSIEIDKSNPLVEVTNIYVNLGSSDNIKEDTDPNIPWAEDHFQERIGGKPINPGKEYRNWPYYDKFDNDELFRKDGKFSHNYMERYWCSDLEGLRYKYGDLNDIIERLKSNNDTRQAYLSVWHPEDQSNNNVRVPCTLGYWFYKENGRLNCTYHIRSCDAVRHLRNDIYMTYRLLQHVAEKSGMESGELMMWIGSLHCFKSDLYYIKKYVRNTNN